MLLRQDTFLINIQFLSDWYYTLIDEVKHYHAVFAFYVSIKQLLLS